MIIKISSDIYSKPAVLKAAFHFTDMAYVLIDYEAPYYVISMTPKGDSELDVEEEFKNELLMQEVRSEINEQTASLRAAIATRALASTVIGEEDIKVPSKSFKVSEVFKDWFENENS
ncbi:MAG: His-Xaa-Ser system protein HxsD [Oscillospiraceae bacterium]|nr:His-Xaa-Ser system protein HxsD [Oscillospiraceae bacterium]